MSDIEWNHEVVPVFVAQECRLHSDELYQFGRYVQYRDCPRAIENHERVDLFLESEQAIQISRRGEIGTKFT